MDLAFPRGKVTGIMGPSGCGKTTLLRLIAAQLRPERGEVWVNGVNLPTLGRSGFHKAIVTRERVEGRGPLPV